MEREPKIKVWVLVRPMGYARVPRAQQTNESKFQVSLFRTISYGKLLLRSNKAERLNRNNQLRKIKRDSAWLHRRAGTTKISLHDIHGLIHELL